MKLIFTLMIATAFVAVAADKPIKMRDMPPAVQKAVQEQAKGAEIKGLQTEVENGKTFYEVETLVNGRTRDMLLDKTGKVVEVEEEASLDSIPPAAKAALEKKAAGGKITKVETVTKGDAVSYEAAITGKGGKKSEFAVKADGSAAK
jgi:uncharacterized membrane protein YkoI